MHSVQHDRALPVVQRDGDTMTTSTDIERHEGPAPAMAEPWGAAAAPAVAGSKRAQRAAELQAWADSAMAAHSVAQVLCRTPFVPVAYRDNPYAATAAILSGDELGLSPMMSLVAFHVIEGRAAPAAQTLRAVVQAAGHEIYVEESTDARCVVAGRRRRPDGTYGPVQRSTYTTARARQMGLLGRKTWRENPTAMLLARASSECSRMIGSDAILGIPYSAEELWDQMAEPDGAVPAGAPQREARGRAPAGRRGTPAPRGVAAPPAVDDQPPLPSDDPVVPGAGDEPEQPPLPDEQPVADVPADEQPELPPAAGDDPRNVAPPEEKQLRALGAILKKGEVTDRAEALDICAHIVRHPVTSRNALTIAECSKVLDVLRGWERNPQHIDGFAGRMADELNAYALAQDALPDPGDEGMPEPDDAEQQADEPAGGTS